MRFSRALALAAASILTPVFAGSPAQTAAPVAASPYSDTDVIEYRKHIMSALNEQSEAIGQVLAGVVPDDNAVAQLQSLALTASVALKAFEPHVDGGESTATVWTNWSDFQGRMKDFADRTAEMARLAREKGKDAGLEKIADALTCKSCHDTYRSGYDDSN